MTWIIVLVVVVLLALWLVGQYNNLVRMRNNRENAFANIDVQLRQRYDLIPQLVATVKGYATHEKELLQRVTEARTAAMGATNINDKIAADNQLTGALAGLKLQLEAYPDLKANQNFMQLQTEIADIENKLAATRRFFNSATRELNNAVQVFPSNIIAQMFGFHKEVMFEIPQTDREAMDKAPEIKFRAYAVCWYDDADTAQQPAQRATSAVFPADYPCHGVGVPRHHPVDGRATR